MIDPYENLTDKQFDLVMSTGIDYVCGECGTELSIFDDECSECNTSTHWSTDCTVQDIIEAIGNGEDSIDE